MITRFKTASVASVCLMNTISFASEMTIETYLDQVKVSNLGVRSVELRAKALKSKIDPVSTLDDPFIAIGKDEIPFGGGMGSVTRYQISQSIPFPGKLSARGDIAEYKAKSAESDIETTQRETALLSAQIFYRLYYNQKALELNENLKKLVQGIVESSKVRYQSGGSEHHDWLLSRIEQNIVNVDRLKLLREKKSLSAVFNELRNEPVGALLEDLKINFSNDAKLETPSYQNLPELKSLDFALNQYSSELKLAKLSYFPDFVVQGMAMKPSPEMMDQKSTWGFMVGINLPLFFWRKQSDLLEASKLEHQVAQIEKKRIENRLQAEEVDAREQFNTARDVVEQYLKSIMPATELAIQNAKSGYATRRLPLSQFIETLKVEQTQKLELIAAQIDVELALLRTKNLISSPPLIKFAPSRPSLIGGGSMGGATNMSSDTVNMGSGMSGITKKSKENSSGANQNSGSGMGNM